MPLCLMCPKGNQPVFSEIRDLTNHIAQLHLSPLTQLATSPRVSSTQCCICNKRFTTNVGLVSHQHAKQHYLPCPTCSKTFLAPEQLVQHQSDVHSSPSAVHNDINGPSPPEKQGSAGQKLNYDCHECKRRFESPTELEKHQSSHRQFPCSKCDQSFPSLIDWNNHFKSEHPRFQCGACKTVFTSDPELASHGGHCPAITRPTSSQSSGSKSASSSSLKNLSLVCELCNKCFKNHGGLQAHVAAKHSAAVKCGICQLACSSPTALEKHVEIIHSCALCQDGILRDARTLEDHMADHSHPARCVKCDTRYRSEEERSLHFAALDNDHPICAQCSRGFEDEPALQAHMVSAHPPSPRQSPRPHLKCTHCDEKFIDQGALDVHTAVMHFPVFECGVCHYTSSSQTDLDAHIATAHSCPICKEGIYLDTNALEDHLDHHRAPYRCVSCGTAYTEQDQLLQHYKTSSNDIHPICVKCDVGFETDDAYNAHIEEVHPRFSCDSCDGALFDEEDLPAHYLSSRNHPVCDKCGMGFRDQFDFADHGATEHPEAHCFLCQWQFDSPDSLYYHIRHFVNHPKCTDCDLRFADADAYQHHLFVIHRPRGDDSAVIPPYVNSSRGTHAKLSSPPLSKTYGPQWPSEGKASLSQASFTPLLPSLSGYSSPRSQRIVMDSPLETSSRARSLSSTLSVGQHSSRESQESQHWESVSRSVPLDDEQTQGGTPEFNHSPLSMLPAVGTPLMSSTQTIPSVDFRSPFSPRPEIAIQAVPTLQNLVPLGSSCPIQEQRLHCLQRQAGR
ncbi:hypothetical protein F5I97DRAFT_354869 [Phlebopus sp. FC_14]|nr:hypothetical protein F5I97DRAFT_354869 [Phlebopus sp. FC_14]